MTVLKRINQDDLRNHNLSVVLNTMLRSTSAFSRADLAKETGLTKATMSLLVSMLLSHHIVKEGAPLVQSVYGRPSTPLSIAGGSVCGIGIQINHYGEGKTMPMSVSDKNIKVAIEELLKAKDERGEFVFKNKKQWWAVYRVLFYYSNYPSQMTAFKAKMEELDVTKVDGKRDFSYESLSAATKEVPSMATCAPATWNTLKDKSDNYKQQYVVAEFLMLKLGIKS